MKKIIIEKNKLDENDRMDRLSDEAIIMLLSEYSIMESPIIYFSTGNAEIKEVLIKKTPTFSV